MGVSFTRTGCPMKSLPHSRDSSQACAPSLANMPHPIRRRLLPLYLSTSLSTVFTRLGIEFRNMGTFGESFISHIKFSAWPSLHGGMLSKELSPISEPTSNVTYFNLISRAVASLSHGFHPVPCSSPHIPEPTRDLRDSAASMTLKQQSGPNIATGSSRV